MSGDIKNIISQFGISEFNTITPIRNAVWNIDNKYILKSTDCLNNLKKSVDLSNQLAQKNIAVAKFIPSEYGGFYYQDGNLYYSLMHKVNGICMNVNKGDYVSNAEHIGKAVALLTHALDSCECVYCHEGNCIKDLNGWIKDEIKQKPFGISDTILNYLDGFEPLYKKLPRQIIHKDLNPGNMLFDENMKFQGFIDLDIAEINVRAYDISYLLQCLFVGDKNPERINKQLEIAHCIFGHYNKIIELTDDERLSITYFFVYIGVMLYAWFIKCGLYDIADSCAKGTEWAFNNKHLFVF